MRTEMSLQDYLDFGSKSSVKIVREWQQKYLAIDEVLRKNTKIIRLAHEDFRQWLSESAKGRKSKYTTDQIVRSLMVMFLEEDKYREVVIRIDGSRFLRKFVGLGPWKQMMDFTFLSRALSALRPETLMAINKVVAKYAREAVHRPAREEQEQEAQAGGQEEVQGGSYEDKLLAHCEELADRVIRQAEKRVFEGIILPADQELYSIFEEHTELIKRGKAGKEVEFGHKIMLARTEEKFISQYEVYEKREEDPALVDDMLKPHREMFGDNPDLLTLDQGFYESPEQLAELRDEISTVSIRKKGRKSKHEQQLEDEEQFKDGQRFRAGIEGTISVLKRGYKLDRCLFKGFKNYAASVGLAVLCHNLVLLTRL